MDHGDDGEESTYSQVPTLPYLPAVVVSYGYYLANGKGRRGADKWKKAQASSAFQPCQHNLEGILGS